MTIEPSKYVFYFYLKESGIGLAPPIIERRELADPAQALAALYVCVTKPLLFPGSFGSLPGTVGFLVLNPRLRQVPA